MGKKHVGRDSLSSLVASAAKLQEALRSLRPIVGSNDELEAAYDGVRLALNRIIVEILRSHLSEVEVRLDPRQSQVWNDRRAVLEVVVGAIIIRMPVPMLRSVDPELVKRLQGRKPMNTIKIYRCVRRPLPTNFLNVSVSVPVGTLMVAGNREAHQALAGALGIQFSTALDVFKQEFELVKEIEYTFTSGPSNGDYYFYTGQESQYFNWHYRRGWSGRPPTAEDFGLEHVIRLEEVEDKAVFLREQVIGQASTVIKGDNFIPDPRFSYEPVEGSELVLVVHEPLIAEFIRLVLEEGQSLENAGKVAYEQFRHPQRHTIWGTFWNYGCGWSREPDSYGIIPDGWITISHSYVDGHEPLWKAVLRAKSVAAEWCDTSHLFKQVDWEYRDDDDEEGYPVYAEEPEVIVNRPEEGNWVTVTQTIWLQGQGYVEFEIARFRCAEGNVREEYQ